MEGCLEWQRRGLDVPDRVRNYTEEYRAENDPLAEWIAHECHIDKEHATPARELRNAYERWCEQNGTKPIDANRRWGHVLKAHGCTRQRSTAGERRCHGIHSK